MVAFNCESVSRPRAWRLTPLVRESLFASADNGRQGLVLGHLRVQSRLHLPEWSWHR
jgi:hypothetical protein